MGIIVLTIVVVLVFGGGIGLYIYSTSPSVVIGKALSVISNANSFGYYLSADALIHRENITNDKFTQSVIPYESAAVISRGIVDLSGGGNGAVNFSVEAGISQSTNPSAQLLWNMGVISAGGKMFLKLNTLATATTSSRTLINQIMLQWVTLDVASTDQLNLFMPRKFAEGLADYRSISPQNMAQIKSEFTDSTIIKSIADLGSEQINGINTRHYQISFDAQKMESIIQEFYQARGGQGEWLSASFDNPWDVWVDQNTGAPYRIKTVLGNQQNVAFELKDIDLYLSGFNSQPAIFVPQAISLANIFKLVQ